MKWQSTVFALLLALAGNAWAAGEVDTDALLRQGEQQWQAGALDQAQSSFEAATRADPRSSAALMKLAGLQLSRQEFLAGIASYQRAIGLDARNGKAWLGLGFSYLHTAQNGLALAAFNEAVRVAPQYTSQLQPIFAKLNAQ